MRVFSEFNSYTACPICGTSNKGQSVLIAIDGTQKGNIEQAEQVHLDCLSLRMSKTSIHMPDERIVYQLFDVKGGGENG